MAAAVGLRSGPGFRASEIGKEGTAVSTAQEGAIVVRASIASPERQVWRAWIPQTIVTIEREKSRALIKLADRLNELATMARGMAERAERDEDWVEGMRNGG